MNRLIENLAPVRSSESWLRFAIYSLIVFSTFSRTGVDGSIILLEFVVLYRWLRFRRIEKPPFWMAAPFLVFLGTAVLSSLVNPNLPGNLIALHGLFRFLLPFVMVPALFAVDSRRLLSVFAAIVVLVALYGMAQYYFGINWLRPEKTSLIPLGSVSEGGSVLYRAKGVFRNPIIYSSVMLMVGVLLVSLFMSARGTEKKFWLAAGVMSFVAVASSGTRSAALGLFVGLLVLAVRLRPRYSVPLISISLAGFALLAGLVLSGKLRMEGGEVAAYPLAARFLNSNIENATERLYRWEAGWLAIQQNPWLGVGPDKTLKAKVIRFMIKVSRKHGNYKYRLLPTGLIHNVHLQVAFHYGWLGLAAVFGIWAAFFYWNGLWIRRAGAEAPFEVGILWGTSAALAGSLIDGFFNNNFLDGMNQAVIMMFFGLSLHSGLVIRRRLAGGSEGGGDG